MREGQTCEHCVFFLNTQLEGKNYQECLRMAPNKQAGWPKVTPKNWCNRFQQDQEKQHQ